MLVTNLNHNADTLHEALGISEEKAFAMAIKMVEASAIAKGKTSRVIERLSEMADDQNEFALMMYVLGTKRAEQ